MSRKTRVFLTATAILGLTTLACAGSCIDNGCHAPQMKNKHLHGPLAAEEVMGNGCNQCHLPNGEACTATSAGKYKFVVPKEAMCTSCHDKSESPEHLKHMSGCLKCHSPHGSDVSIYLLRAN